MQQVYKMQVTVPEDRRIMIELPDSVPMGQVELIVLVLAEGEDIPATTPDLLARLDAFFAEMDRAPRRS
jgi:hypothetical protein